MLEDHEGILKYSVLALLQAVRLVTELSLEYKVYDSQLWNGLLQKLLGFNMVRNF